MPHGHRYLAWMVLAICLGGMRGVGAEHGSPIVADTQARSVGARRVGPVPFRGIYGRLRISHRPLPGRVPDRPGPFPTPSDTLDATLLLLPDGTGVSVGRGRVSGMTWRRRDARTVTIEAASLWIPPERLRWDALDMTIIDADSDGVFERGEARCACSWSAVTGDVAADGESRYDFELAPLAVGPQARIAAPDSWADLPPVPTDRLEVTFSAPVPALRALAALRLTADGREVPGTFEVTDSEHVQAARFTFTPRTPLPHGARLAVVADGVVDLAGHPVSMGREVTRVVDDPGPLTQNATFTSGLRGWTTRHHVFLDDTSGEAVSRRAGARVDSGWLLGYVDVPPAASTMRVSLTFTVRGRSDAREATGWVRTMAADGTRSTLDVLAAGPPGRPVSLDIDLRPYRGQRLYIEAEAVETSMLTGRPGAAITVHGVAVR